MKSCLKLLVTVIVFVFLGCPSALAQDDENEDWNDWNFNISPYFWFMGFDGTLTTPPLPPEVAPLPESESNTIDIDIGFKDVRNSIKYVNMLSGQYRNKKISVVLNYSHLILEGEAITPYQILIQQIDFRFRHIAGDISVQYRFLQKPKWEIDAGLGLKILDEKIESVINFPSNTSAELDSTVFWADPVISTLVRYMPHKKVEIGFYADVGSGLIGDLSYQSLGAITYRFSKLFFTSIGYRIWGVSKEFENAILKGTVNGATARIGFRF